MGHTGRVGNIRVAQQWWLMSFIHRRLLCEGGACSLGERRSVPGGECSLGERRSLPGGECSLGERRSLPGERDEDLDRDPDRDRDRDRERDCKYLASSAACLAAARCKDRPNGPEKSMPMPCSTKSTMRFLAAAVIVARKIALPTRPLTLACGSTTKTILSRMTSPTYDAPSSTVTRCSPGFFAWIVKVQGSHTGVILPFLRGFRSVLLTMTSP